MLCAQQHMQRQASDKEQQINQEHEAYGQLQHNLESTLQTIAKETADIKNLEEQLTGGECFLCTLCTVAMAQKDQLFAWYLF